MNQIVSILVVLLFYLTFFAHGVMAITGGEIVKKLRDRLENYVTYSMRFEKEFYWSALDKTRSRSGTFYMQNPNKFRVGIDNGDVVVADGTTVWSYIDRNKQVLISDYEGDLQNPWQIFVDYSTNFVTIGVKETKIAGKSAYMLSMKEESNNSLGRGLKIWVDKKKWWMLQIEFVETNGDITTYRLKEHKVNKKIKSSRFSFLIPDGIEVVDRRTQPFLKQ